MMIPHILTEESATIVLDGKAYTMAQDNPAFREVCQALAQDEHDEEQLKNLFDLSRAVEDYVDGNVEVKDGAVYYMGEPIHNHLVDRILDFMGRGLPFKPLIRFMDRLMANPSRRAVDELYRFLEHKAMPLTPDGCFLAYKGVNHDFTDKYSGKFDNSVGQVLEMRRNGVCDNADLGCSSGFHAGSHEYAKGYASGGGNLMIVKIDPADVVSVPHDCDCQKLRTCKYEVVSLHQHIDTPLDDGLNDSYGDYSEYDESDYDEGYNEGYAQAKRELEDSDDAPKKRRKEPCDAGWLKSKKKQKKPVRDSKGRFCKANG